MATNNRDVKMTLSVETLGQEDIKKLQNNISALGKEAGDAAPEFQRLADEIGQLGASADALRAFESLGAKFEETSQKQRELAASAELLGNKLEEARQKTEAARDAQERAKKAYLDGDAALNAATAAITIYSRTTNAAGKETQGYKDELARLVGVQTAAKDSLTALRVARADANKEVTEAASAETKAANALETTQKRIDALARSLEKQQAGLKEAGDALERVGLVAGDAAASQAKLQGTIDAITQDYANLQTVLGGVTQATERLSAAEALAAQRATEAANQRAAAAQREADIDREQEAILQRNLAQREAYNRRRADSDAESARLAAQSVEQQAAREAQALRDQLAAEQAAGERLIALKREINARVNALVAERSEREQAALAATAAAARASAQAMDSAFSTLGVRSLQAVEAEIEDVRLAMQKVQSESGQTGAALAGAMAAGNARIKELQREVRELTGQLTLADRASDLLRNSMGQIAAGNLIADAIGSLVEKVKEMGREFVSVNIQAETMRRALNAIYKDAGVTRDQIEFLNRTASQAGVSISGIADSFVKFSAATSASNIPLQVTNDVFEALTRAGATLGLSTERVQLALSALGQIASKGVVSMEELRQQLGDSLPGALTLTAKGLGITDAELIKLVESGRLASRDFFPALTKGLKTVTGETEGIVKAWNDFKNNLTLTAQQAGANGGVAILTTAIKALNVVVTSIVGVLADLVAMVTASAKVFGILLAAVRTLTNPMEDLKQVYSELNDSISANGDRTAVALGLMTQTEAAARAAARGKKEETVAVQEGTVAVKGSGDAYRAAAEAGLKFGDAARASAIAARISSDEATELGSRYVQLGIQLGAVQKSLENDIVIRGKSVKAAEEQAAAIRSNAELLTDETLKLQENARASQIVIDATVREAESRGELAAALAAELQAKIILAEQDAAGLEGRKEDLELLRQRTEKAAEEARVVQTAADALRAKAAAQEEASRKELASLKASSEALAVQRDMLRDNSNEASTLRSAMESARAELERVAAAAAQGATTSDELGKAQEKASLAAARYRDAMADQTANIQANTNAKKSAVAVEIEGLQLELQVLRQAEQRARSLGDERGAREAVIAQKRIEIQIAELQIQMMRIEAEGAIALARAKMAELEASNQLTASKRIELETTIKVSEAKLAQVGIRERIVQGMRNEADAFANSSSNLSRETSEVDDNTESWERNAQARGRAAKAAKAGVDSDGFTTGTNGQRVSAELPTWMSIFNQLKSRGLSEEQARAIAAEFTDSNGQVQYFNNPGQIKYGRGTGMSLNAAVDEAAGQVLRNNSPLLPGATRGGGGAFGGAGTSAGVGRSPNGTPTTSSGGYTVNVNINGSNTRISTASQADADALARLLASLGNSASTSTARTGG